MTKLEPFRIFKVYHACFLHYTTDYDYQKYQGKTSYKLETFEHRKDKYSYHKLVRLFEKEHYDYKDIEYYIAWLFFSHDEWVTTHQITGGLTNFELDWRNYSTNRVQLFIDDVKRLQSLDSKHVFESHQTGAIHAQAILILDRVTGGLIERMNGDLKGSFMWDSLHKRMVKFRPFYQIHEPIHEAIFRPHIPETLWADRQQEM